MTGPSQPPPPWEAHPPLGEGFHGGAAPDADEDTGPIRVAAVQDTTPSTSQASPTQQQYVPPVGARWDASYRPVPRPEDTFAGRFTAPLTVAPRAVPVRRKGIHPGVVAAGVVAVALVALVAWLLWPSGESEQVVASPTHEPTPTIDSEASEELSKLLPAGYPSDACEPVAAPDDAAAVMDCAKNADRGGPQTATYTLWQDADGLEAGFDDLVANLEVVNCPGNIQSPGPWRRNASLDKVAGTLVCGLEDGRPTVAWTTDATLVLNVARADPKGPTLDQLYKWWSGHS